jgi:plasmid stabilization system protein ParE
VAYVRWSTAALHRFEAILEWQEQNRGTDQAARVAADIRSAVRAASSAPDLYPWVGSIFQDLADLPHAFRRVLTRPAHHAVYYRYDAHEDGISILDIRGSGQRQPAPDDLT